MNLAQYKKQLFDRLANGALGEVIAQLLNDINSTDAKNTVVIRSSEWVKLNKSKDNNVISNDEFNLAANQITVAIQNVIHALGDQDVKLPDDPLQAAIAALNLEPRLPKVSLVNVDRNAPFLSFQNSFETFQTLPYQFYFIVGSPDQQPNYFAERSIYEIIAQVLVNDEKAIYYKREPFKIGDQIIERACIEPLPFSGFGLEACKNLFKANIQERVAHLQIAFNSIEEFAALPDSRLPYQYFTLVYSIDLDAWGGQWHRNLSPYLSWIIETFRNNHKSNPVFQFIFVINRTNIHETPDPALDQALQQLINAFNPAAAGNLPNPCTRIEGLTEVKDSHIREWLIGLTRQRLQFQVESIVEIYCKKLIQEGRWDGVGDMDMADVEELILEVHRITNSR